MGGYILVVVLFLAALIGGIAVSQQEERTAQDRQGVSDAVVGSMMVYRNRVSAFASANPTHTGEVANSSLNLPAWFTPIDGVRNYVTSGQGYVYFQPGNTESGQAYDLMKQTKNNIMAGIKRSNVLYNPIAGTTMLALPSAIPEGAVVFAPTAQTISAAPPASPPPPADCVVPAGTSRTWTVSGLTCSGSHGATSVTSGYSLTITSTNGNPGGAGFMCNNGTLATTPNPGATCTAGPCVLPSPSTETATETRTGYQTLSCASGYVGQIDQSRPEQRTRSRTAYCPAPTGAYAWNPWGPYTAWSGTGPWTTYSNTCQPQCTVPPPETQTNPQTQTLACPAGQVGQINQSRTQTRTRTAYCPAQTGPHSWNAWSAWSEPAWTTTSNTCRAPCSPPPAEERWVPYTAECPEGYKQAGGYSNWRYRETRSYSCPTAESSPVVSGWTWDGQPGQFVNNGTCVQDPPPCTPNPTQYNSTTEYQTTYCPAGQYGQYNQSRTGTQSRTSYCPGPTWNAWSAYTYTAWQTNSGGCTSCPPSSTETTYQWVATGQACPAGYSGSHTWEKQQAANRSVSYNCPAGTTAAPGATYSAWGAWSDTGATRNVVNTCAQNCVVPSPSTQTNYQWVARSGACPAGYSGTATWEAEQYQQRTAYCPAQTGSPAWGAWGAWADTGSTRNYSTAGCAQNCTLPNPSTESTYQWVPRSAGCPTGYTGSQSWEAQQVATRSAYCPAATGAYAWGGYGAWSDTGATRNFVNTCTSEPPTRTQITQCRKTYRTVDPPAAKRIIGNYVFAQSNPGNYQFSYRVLQPGEHPSVTIGTGMLYTNPQPNQLYVDFYCNNTNSTRGVRVSGRNIYTGVVHESDVICECINLGL